MRTRQDCTLTNESIGAMTETVREKAAAMILDRKEALRVVYALEEALLKCQEHFGEACGAVLFQTATRGRYKVRVRIPGLSYNPLEPDDGEYSEILQSLMASQGFSLQWSYRDGANVLSYTFKRQRRNGMLLNLAAAILLAAVCAGACQLLPETVREVITDKVFQPVYETFLDVISCIACPLVLLSVMWGVFSTGDVASFSRMGRRMIARFLIMMLIMGGVTLLVALPFYAVTRGVGSSFAFYDLYTMILDIIPGNFLEPFLSGNTLQIIFLAVIIGLAMLILADKTTVAAKFVEQTNYIVQLIMETVSRMIPMFVFLSIFTLLVHDGIALIRSSYKLLLTVLLSAAVVLALYVLLVSLHKKVSARLLVKKIMPTFLIALTTSSSSAAFGTNVETCEKRMGLDRRLVNIGVPLGQTVFMPGTTLMFYCIVLFVAQYYQVPISLNWMITLMLISVILAVAAPPVPGGGLACYTMIVMNMGLPIEATALCCALGVLPEFLATATNLATLQLELVELGGDLKMLDTDCLRK